MFTYSCASRLYNTLLLSSYSSFACVCVCVCWFCCAFRKVVVLPTQDHSRRFSFRYGSTFFFFFGDSFSRFNWTCYIRSTSYCPSLHCFHHIICSVRFSRSLFVRFILVIVFFLLRWWIAVGCFRRISPCVVKSPSPSIVHPFNVLTNLVLSLLCTLFLSQCILMCYVCAVEQFGSVTHIILGSCSSLKSGLALFVCSLLNRYWHIYLGRIHLGFI